MTWEFGSIIKKKPAISLGVRFDVLVNACVCLFVCVYLCVFKRRCTNVCF